MAELIRTYSHLTQKGLAYLYLSWMKAIKKTNQAPTFKAVKLPIRPHIFWYVMHKPKLMTEVTVGFLTLLSIVAIIIKIAK